MKRAAGLSTRAVHAGSGDGPAITTPIFQSATFLYPRADGGPLLYSRYGNNPTQEALAEKLARLEEAEAALPMASGMAAIATSLLSVLSAGDHLVAARELYGGTLRLLREELPRLGIEVTFVPSSDPDAFAVALRPNTRAAYVESVTNPLVEVTDIPLVRRALSAAGAGVPLLVDATFATPVNQQPLTLGADLVIHSATKYLAGHSDLIAGVVAGSARRIDAVRGRMTLYGGALDPHACFLLDRGLKTLEVRVLRQNANAQAVAEWLSGHPAVERVHYPGLGDGPGRVRAGELLRGFGGVLSFLPRTDPAGAEALLGRLRLIRVAPSLGGVDSLVSLPRLTSHVSLVPEERRAMGIDDALVRLALGIENLEDLREDLEGALGPV